MDMVALVQLISATGAAILLATATMRMAVLQASEDIMVLDQDLDLQWA